MPYAVKEIFYSLQGEGAQAGRPAVFCRFAGCNLWSGREEDRALAICRFCDTDFVLTPDSPDGGRFESPEALADKILSLWPDADTQAQKYAVLTGGEPLLQLDRPLIDALHDRGFEIGVETNGTLPAPGGIDWLCVSPKAGAPLRQLYGDELKLVYPQTEALPENFEMLTFRHRFLQPMDGPEQAAHTRAALDYCLAHPIWRLSLQLHKLIGIR